MNDTRRLGLGIVVAAMLSFVTVAGVAGQDEPASLSVASIAVSDTASDGTFELTLSGPKATRATDEPIDVSATFTYVGDRKRATVRLGGDTSVGFWFEQLDGSLINADRLVGDTSCGTRTYVRGEPEVLPFRKSGWYDPRSEDPEEVFWRTWLKDPELHLPAGSYRIGAGASYGDAGCDEHQVTAAIEITVVEAPDSTPSPSAVPTDTASAWGPLAVFTDPTNGPGADAGFGPGVISIGDRCVTFRADRAQVPTTLMWAEDTVAWRPNTRRIVFTDRQGDVVRVNDGDRLMLGGVRMWPAPDSQTPEPGQRWSAGLDERWVSEPDLSCPAALWYVGEIDVRKRATKATPVASQAPVPTAEPNAALRETSPALEGTWRAMATAPFSSAKAAGAWLDGELVVMDIATARAASYDPTTDTWNELGAPGGADFDWNSPWAWTGEEFVITDRGTGRVQAFDPVARTWRDLPAVPFGHAEAITWADGDLVAAAYQRREDTEILRSARLGAASDTWQRLPNIRDLVYWFPSLLWTGDEVVTAAANGAPREILFRLRRGVDGWEQSAPAPPGSQALAPALSGRELLYLSESDSVVDVAYDLDTGGWSTLDATCPMSSNWDTWLDGLLINPYLDPYENSPHLQPGFAFDPASGDCYALAADPVLLDYLAIDDSDWPRTPALTIEADGALILWSGALIGADLAPSDELPSLQDGDGVIFTPGTTTAMSADVVSISAIGST